MKRIILNNQKKSKKKNKTPIRIILKDNHPTPITLKPMFNSLEKTNNVKKIILNKTKTKDKNKRIYTTTVSSHEIHKIRDTQITSNIFKLKNLKNNQNIKYFKNLPSSEDRFICSILARNFNIIKS